MIKSIRVLFFLVFFSCGYFCFATGQNIVIYGDSQGDYEARCKVANAILQVKPGIVFCSGDYVDDGLKKEDWFISNKIAAGLFKSAKFYPAFGNHEKNSPLFFSNFNLPRGGGWYSVEQEGIHFTVLNSSANFAVDSRQYKWLKSDLEKIKDSIKFRIVILHYPFFNTNKYFISENRIEDQLKRCLLPSFQKYRINIVFSGHIHNYQRFLYNNIQFVISGGGGAPLRNQERMSPYLQKFVKDYNFCVLKSENNFLTVKVLNANLDLLDEFRVPADQSRNSK